MKATKTKDGASSPEYRSYQKMRERCLNPNHKYYKNYGERGITICPAWLRSFDQFAADMGPRPSLAHSLDRIDNERGYEPTNCRWATRTQQNRNTRTNRLITAFGRTQPLPAWAEEVGLKHSTLRRRLDAGWDAERLPSAVAFVSLAGGVGHRIARRVCVRSCRLRSRSDLARGAKLAKVFSSLCRRQSVWLFSSVSLPPSQSSTMWS